MDPSSPSRGCPPWGCPVPRTSARTQQVPAGNGRRAERRGARLAGWWPLLLPLLGACEPAGPPARRGTGPEAPYAVQEVYTPPGGWAEDVVFVIGREPVTRDEVERWVETVSLVEPSHTRPDHMRKALTNLVYHTKVARQIHPEGWATTRARAERTLELLRTTGQAPLEGQEVQRVHGNWHEKGVDMGLDRWGLARDLPVGEWTLLETLGGWTVMRVVGKPDSFRPDSPVTIEHVTYYFLEPETMKRELEEARPHFPVQVLDPEWRRVMPTLYISESNPDAPGHPSQGTTGGDDPR